MNNAQLAIINQNFVIIGGIFAIILLLWVIVYKQKSKTK